jgi:hypothetical protein
MQNYMYISALACLLSTVACEAGPAELTFKNPNIKIAPPIEDGPVDVVFEYTNTGTETVKVGEIQGACCGVAAPTIPKPIVRPGESGLMVFRLPVSTEKKDWKFGVSTGFHRPLYNIAVSLTGQSGFSISPSILYWTKGAVGQKRTVYLRSLRKPIKGIVIPEVTGLTISVKIKQPSSDYILEITSNGPSSDIEGGLQLKVEYVNGFIESKRIEFKRSDY